MLVPGPPPPQVSLPSYPPVPQPQGSGLRSTHPSWVSSLRGGCAPCGLAQAGFVRGAGQPVPKSLGPRDRHPTPQHLWGQVPVVPKPATSPGPRR